MRAWMGAGLMVAVALFIVTGCGPKKTADLPAVDVTDVKTENPPQPVPPAEKPATSAEKPAPKPAPEKTAPKPAVTTEGPQTHTVQKGDTLFSLAKRYYGDGKLWTKILDANKDKIKDVSTVPVGTVLKIPPK